MIWWQWWGDVWRGDRAASDQAMLGEHRVAQMRVLLVAAFTVYGLVVAAADPVNTAYLSAIPLNLLCLSAALVVLWRTRRGVRPLWLAYATCLWDVSLTSLLHVAELAEGLAASAVNGRVTFLGYFFGLAGTCVRWDRQLPLVIGAVAGLQYLGIVLWAQTIWPGVPPADLLAYGTFDLGVQVERIVHLLLFAVVCRTVVVWSLDLREAAVYDLLTGLLNRRTFEERLRDELLSAQREGHTVSVAVLDVDHFKRVNDQHGHVAGDTALKAVAATIREALRRTDLVARWGGEEFAVVLPNTPLAEAAAKIDDVREALAAMPVPVDGTTDVRLTVSAGVAAGPAEASDVSTLTHVADRRLFAAKRAGRDRVVAIDNP